MQAPSRSSGHRENSPRREHDDGRAVFEPAHFLAFAHGGVAGNDVRAPIAQVQQHVEKLEANARDQDGRHRHQGEQRARRQAAADDGPLVLAEQPLDPLERDGIDVPGVARDVIHLLDAAIVGRVKAVVHARGEPQGRELAAAVVAHEFLIAQQVRAAGTEIPWPAAPSRPRPRRRRPPAHRRGSPAPRGPPRWAARPSLSSRVKQSCRLLKRLFFASRKSRSENRRHSAMQAAQTSGCSMRLSQPMNSVSQRRGMRLVSRKLISSCCAIRSIRERAVILVSFACNKVRGRGIS